MGEDLCKNCCQMGQQKPIKIKRGGGGGDHSLFEFGPAAFMLKLHKDLVLARN